MDDEVDNLTLRQKFTEGERLVRELIEHLEQGFLPKVDSFRRLVDIKITEIDKVDDITIRNQATALTESDHYTESMVEKLSRVLNSIDEATSRLVNEG
ncbi:MAG: hypothetical protein O2955_01005 [Planctomycetota bacterium]|jgi:hypothetical protein|nr:hypothetical protein [Planctomycetota bacterium]MDA1211061.1 hypothetical protein [Planctomycetota bacterium]